ncbi:hypothetical protein [Actinoplanes sp. NPDC051859]|uniref:hypothetical protein n=1 Tax=Actinoplanes sp. NPDC051859 TaxID=3363909 RepID=UPI00379171DB
MHRISRIIVGLVATTAAGVGVFAGAAPASAADETIAGCDYPRVCFYKTFNDYERERPTAAYRDLGPTQTLGSRSKGASVVVNTRNDDGALLHFTNGRTTCLQPNGELLATEYGVVDKITIMNSPICRK